MEKQVNFLIIPGIIHATRYTDTHKYHRKKKQDARYDTGTRHFLPFKANVSRLLMGASFSQNQKKITKKKTAPKSFFTWYVLQKQKQKPTDPQKAGWLAHRVKSLHLLWKPF